MKSTGINRKSKDSFEQMKKVSPVIIIKEEVTIK